MNWKRVLRQCLMAVGIPYIAFVLLFNYFYSLNNYESCEKYTAKLNGGVHVFQGKPLNVSICGLDRLPHDQTRSFYSVPDRARIRVFSMDGELLAERYFEPLWESRWLHKLEYGDDYLIYNDGDGSGFGTRMAMPPTTWDWIRARLPRPWPF